MRKLTIEEGVAIIALGAAAICAVALGGGAWVAVKCLEEGADEQPDGHRARTRHD